MQPQAWGRLDFPSFGSWVGAPSPFTGEQVWGRVVHGPSHCSCLQTLKEVSGPKWTKMVAGPSDLWEGQPCDAGLRGDLGLGATYQRNTSPSTCSAQGLLQVFQWITPSLPSVCPLSKGGVPICQLGKWEHGVPGLVNISQNVA